MLMKTALAALLGLAVAADAASVHQRRSHAGLEGRQNKGGNRGGNKNGGGNNNQGNNNKGNNANSDTCLDPSAIQKGSQSTGQAKAAAADGQVNSATYVLPNPSTQCLPCAVLTSLPVTPRTSSTSAPARPLPMACKTVVALATALVSRMPHVFVDPVLANSGQ